MLLQELIVHEWKKKIRTKGFYNNLAVSILLGFVAVYLGAAMLILGFSLDKILETMHDSLNPMELLNGAMFYILIIGLTFRFFMQQLNTFNIEPYLVLPLKRSSIVDYVLLKSFFNIANYFVLLVVIPFSVKSVAGYYDGTVAFKFVMLVVFIVWFNSQMAAFLKRKYGSGLLSFLLIIATLALLAALEYFKIFSIFNISIAVFNFIVLTPLGLVIPFIAAVGAFLLNKWFFYQNQYPEKYNLKLESAISVNQNFSFFDRFGAIGELISMEIKLIIRHKRTKSMLYMAVIFLFYGLIFYTNKRLANSEGMMFFIAMFVTGFLMLMFGQWAISWDSRHFDSLMTRNISVRTYLEANYFLLLLFNIISFILTTPYFYFGTKIMYMHLVAFVFNIGVNIFLLLFFSTYNTKRLDLSKTQAMNYQGTTFKSFLIVMPIMFFPMLIITLMSTFFSMTVALCIVASIGVLGILLRKQLFNICVGQFNKRKYHMAEGFRESE